MDGLLGILVIALGLLLIWWLCDPTVPRNRSVRREGSEARESETPVDARGR